MSNTSSSIRAFSRPLGGLLAFGLGVAGFAAPALHDLGQTFSTALIVAGLGVYHVSVNGTRHITTTTTTSTVPTTGA